MTSPKQVDKSISCPKYVTENKKSIQNSLFGNYYTGLFQER